MWRVGLWGIVMNLGYIRLFRSILDKGYYQDSECVHLWVHLLLKASYQEKEYLFNGRVEKLKPGQFITGRKALSKETGINNSKVERILNMLKIEQQIEQQSFNKFRIITILNWGEYQQSEQQIEQQVNSKRTASEQQVNTNNKEKKVKNIKNEIIETPIGVDVEIWDAFIEMRKKMKAPLTAYSVKLVVENLKKLSNGNYEVMGSILKQSIENNWKGVFPLNVNSGNGRGSDQKHAGIKAWLEEKNNAQTTR